MLKIKYALVIFIAIFSTSLYSAVPSNDNLANAIVITTSPFSHSIPAVDAVDATNETNEQLMYGGGSDEASVWYQYTPLANGNITIENGDDTSDTLECDSRLGVFTGTTFPLTQIALIDDDLGWLIDGETLTIPVTAGTTYYIQTGISVSQVTSGAVCKTNVTFAATAAATTPTNIPIFGPVGLLAMLGGLLWFGNRRRKG